MEMFFWAIAAINNVLWTYLGVTIILAAGLYFTIKSKFFQIKTIFSLRQVIKKSLDDTKDRKIGAHPIKLYFASVGGMIGLGNLVFVMGTLQIGGPGSLVWLWIASFLGMLIKYSEIYLGVKYRINDKEGSYHGGPMYFLQAAFGNKVIPAIVAFLLCIYGVEIFQFNVVSTSIASVFRVERYIGVIILLALVLTVSLGGVKRLANVCTFLMPPFIICYMLVAFYILYIHQHNIPAVFQMVFASAFEGWASLGLASGGILVAAHAGASRAVYSGDIGIGYDSIVQSETMVKNPAYQARLAIFGLLLDTIICTLSILIVLVTGVWQYDLEANEFIAVAIDPYLPYTEIFIHVLFFLAGFTTLIAYLVVGVKTANYLNPKFGKGLYILYAILAFSFFSFQDISTVSLIMEFAGGILMIINVCGMFKLRNEIKFSE